MKKLIKKLAVSTIAIALVLQPIFVTMFNIGESRADQYAWTQIGTQTTTAVLRDNGETHFELYDTTYTEYELSYSYYYTKYVAQSEYGKYVYTNTITCSTNAGGYKNLKMSATGTKINSGANKGKYRIDGRVYGKVRSDRTYLNLSFGFPVSATLTPTGVQPTGNPVYHYKVYAKTRVSGGSSSSGGSTTTSTTGSKEAYTGQTWTPGSGGGGSSSSTPAAPVEKEIKLTDDQKRLYIRALYRRILKREPGNSEIEWWLPRSVQNISRGIINSKESNEKNSTDKLSYKDFVTNLYKWIMGRTASEKEIQWHVDAMDKGMSKDTIINNFVEADEYYKLRNKEIQTITLNKELCTVVYNYLINDGYEVIKPTDTTIKMFKGDIGYLKKLDISGKKITDLSGLNTFSNLEELIAPNNNIENLSDLSKLTKLKRLNLKDNSISESNLDVICGITSLEELNLENNGLIDSYINGKLGKLTNLKKLYISNNSLKSLEEIEKITGLRVLYADANNIKNVDAIRKLNLDEVSIKSNIISDGGTGQSTLLPSIFKMAKEDGNKLYTSEDLECENCKIVGNSLVITDPTKKVSVKIKGGPADGTTYKYQYNCIIIRMRDKVLAKRLSNYFKGKIISNNYVNGQYIMGLDEEDVEDVRMLDLSVKEGSMSSISDITGLEYFTNLKILNLNNNKVKNLNTLSQLKKLRTLTVRFNDLTNLDALQDVTSLKQLDASNNAIVDINGLSKLTNLENLILADNNIQDNLKPIIQLEKLSVLDISNNNVSSLRKITEKSIPTLYASRNKLKSLASVTVENVELENNEIIIETDNQIAPLPAAVKRAIIENNGIDGFILENCKISDGNVELNDDATEGTITITKGFMRNSIVKIQAPKDTTPPVLNVEYQKNNDGTVNVTITSNEPVKQALPFKISEDRKTMTRKYIYNSDEEIRVYDYAGNYTNQRITVTGIENEDVPGLSVSYNTYELTNLQDGKEVILTVKADVPLYDFESSQRPYRPEKCFWQISEDKKTFTHKYTSQSASAKLEFMTQENYDTYGFHGRNSEHVVTIETGPNNIDVIAPRCTIEYDTQEITNGSVRVTVWSDEEISIKDKDFKAVTRNDDRGFAEFGAMLYYARNTAENITIVDKAGNETRDAIVVNNIDNGIEGLSAKAKGMNATNKNTTLNVSANEKITVNSQIGSLLNNSYANENSVHTKYSYKVASNTSVLPKLTKYISLAEVNSNEGAINDIAETIEDDDEETENTLSYEITDGSYGIIEVEDVAKNKGVTVYDTTFVDKEISEIGEVSRTTNEDGTVTIVIGINEEIKSNGDFEGWTLDKEANTLTKTFKKSTKEVVKLQDLAGNEKEAIIDVKVYNAVNYVADVSQLENSDKYLVTISSNDELKEVEGWELSEDKKSMKKIMLKGEAEDVEIENLNGYGSIVSIVAGEGFKQLSTGSATEESGETDKDKDKETNTNKTDKTDKNDKTKDTKKSGDTKKDTYTIGDDSTKSPKSLPQTGKNILSVVSAALLGGIAFITYTRMRKNKDIK